MVGLFNRLVGGLEVPLGAFCWKARGGGGRLRHAPPGQRIKRS